MNETEPKIETATITLNEAAKLTGISSKTLRHLADHRALPGLVRLERGHVRIRVSEMPTFDQIEALLVARVEASIAELRRFFDRVQLELEAVGNDITELEDDPLTVIGIDLEAFDQLSASGPTTLRGAMRRMGEASQTLWFERLALDELRPRY